MTFNLITQSFSKMTNEILSSLKKKITFSSPIILILIFFIIDTFPFYFFENFSIKTQLTITCIYSWIVINYSRLRPLIILAFGFIFDVYNNLVFGISSLFLIFILIFQKQDNDFLASTFFKNTWIKFLIFSVCYNFFIIGTQKFLFTNITFFLPETIISMIISILFFPVVFIITNFFNEKIKDYDE